MKPRRRTFALFALGIALLSGCATVPKPATTDGSKPRRAGLPFAPVRWQRTELFFGVGNEATWRQFVAEVVTPKFPAGFTELEATGQWQSQNGDIHRIPTRVILLLHPPTPAASQAIEAIRAEFKARTGHESVLRSTGPVTVTF
jgi:hypothetical protein